MCLLETAEAHTRQGLIYVGEREYDLAIAEFNTAIGIDPDDARACICRGIAYHAKGEYDLAIAEFDDAIGIDPCDARAYMNRSIAYHAKCEYELAVTDFEGYVSIMWPDLKDAVDDDEADIHYDRASIQSNSRCQMLHRVSRDATVGERVELWEG